MLNDLLSFMFISALSQITLIRRAVVTELEDPHKESLDSDIPVILY